MKRGLLRSTRGAVFVEYALVLALVSVGASLAVIALGLRLYLLFRAQQSILLSPVP